MIRLDFQRPPGVSFRILCLGAHSDDIEIGCGGTVLKFLTGYPDVEIRWVVFGADDAGRASEAAGSAALFLENAGRKSVEIKKFRDGFFPYIGGTIKECFETLKRKYEPDLIFTHYRHDLHQDHRLISELTYNTFRNHLILEYEIVKYDGDIGNPNVYVPLSGAVCKRKVDLILKCFKSQKTRHWFTRDTFSSIHRIRGLESNADEGYAEGFYCRKMIL